MSAQTQANGHASGALETRPLLTAADVAELLAVSPRFVHDHAAELGVVKLGRCSRFDPADVERFIAERRRSQGEVTPSEPGKQPGRKPASRRPILPARTDLLPGGRA